MYIDLSQMKSGFCDRLRQITFCIALEKLKNKEIKKIQIYEIKTNECPYYFTDLMCLKNIYIYNLKKKKKIKTIKMNPFNSEISLKTCAKFNKDHKVDNFKLLEEWKNIYKLLIPKKKFLSKINFFLKKKKITCIHSRVTDKLLHYLDTLLEIPSKDVIYKKQLEDFCRNVCKLIPSGTKNIYLASDEGIYREKIANNLRSHYKIINENFFFNKKKLRQTSGENFIIDLFVMANCTSIISTTGGNVPLVATLISKNYQTFIKWTNFKFIYKINLLLRTLVYLLRKIFKF